jgi:hypothetical protein
MMNTQTLKQKITLNIIALLIVLPIALFIYERLAPQNNHPSLVDKMQALALLVIPAPKEGKEVMDKEEGNPELDTAHNKNTPPESKVIPKLSIKATAQEIEVADTAIRDKDEQPKFRSIQHEQLANKVEKANDDIFSKGDNLDGEINLPSLSFQGELTERLVYLMLLEGKAKIISKSEHMGNYEYIVKGNTLKQGRFRGLDSIDSLSDRSIELSGRWGVLLRPRYQRATQDSISSTFELRFTRTFNQYLAQQQRQAQQQAGKPITETAFNISINNNKTIFILVKI